MADLPILPLKTDALLADTGHLSAEEFGAYCRILFTMWRHEARLPDNAGELARIAGVLPKVWTKISERVMRPTTSAGGIVSQKRLSSTWSDVQELRKKRAGAADKRWISKRNANASAEHIQTTPICNANQNQTSKKAFLLSEPAARFATALPAGALASRPDTEPAEESGQPRKRASDVSKAELAEIFLRKSASS